jgi:hypothetical protein
MAGLLQNDKVVFYHPLDNAVEKLRNQSWTNTGSFDAGKVGDASVAVNTNTVTVGTASVAVSATSVWTSAAFLTSTKIVVTYYGSDYKYYARVGDLSGISITWGPRSNMLFQHQRRCSVVS